MRGYSSSAAPLSLAASELLVLSKYFLCLFLFFVQVLEKDTYQLPIYFSGRKQEEMDEQNFGLSAAGSSGGKRAHDGSLLPKAKVSKIMNEAKALLGRLHTTQQELHNKVQFNSISISISIQFNSIQFNSIQFQIPIKLY